MRRCKDDWVNATQILKLCNFPKAKRTKILEKGVQQGLHEKVQGGYGRFQGTWIPLHDAQKLAADYGISSDLAPVLFIDPNDPSVIIPRKSKPPVSSSANKDGTPVKRKYVKKPKKDYTPKKMRLENGDLPAQAFFSQDPYSLSRQTPQMNGRSPLLAPHNYNGLYSMQSLPPTFQASDIIPNGSYNLRLPMNGYSLQQQQQQQSFSGNFSNQVNSYNQMQSRSMMPYQGFDGMSQQQFLLQQQHQRGTLSHSTNDAIWSQEDHNRDSDTSVSSMDGKTGTFVDEENSHANQLLRFFSDDNAPIPYFLHDPPPDFNINEAIDDEGHTTLHWAASIGNVPLVHLLLSKGASALVVSNHGLNPLSKCVSFNNCHDMKNFPQIVDLLEVCLINTDINGRTPLHYLCQFSKVSSKLTALTYYLQNIFSKLTIMSTKNGASGVNLIKNVLDHQDVNGDTCLHLAARAGCTQFVKFLLSNSARDDLLNVNNEPAKAIIMKQGLVVYNPESHQIPVGNMQQFYQHPELEAQERKMVAQPGLGTPIQSFSNRRVDTPDTQRTTIQDDEEEDFDDRVSKEHLRILMEGQSGTVDENKENILVEDHPKTPYEAVSTPKQQVATPPAGHKQNVLGVISEATVENSPLLRPSPSRPFTTKQPKLDYSGQVKEQKGTGESEKDDVSVDGPRVQDASTMIHGLLNSLTDSYSEKLKKLTSQKKLIKSLLKEKLLSDEKTLEEVNQYLVKNGLSSIGDFKEARKLVDLEVDAFEHELKSKEAVLMNMFEKTQAYELATHVEEYERKVKTEDSSRDNSSEKWNIAVQLSREQLKRHKYVREVTKGVKQWAINPKMNKYRKLISISCGLRVEDIDGLIDGIEKSLMEGIL